MMWTVCDGDAPRHCLRRQAQTLVIGLNGRTDDHAAFGPPGLADGLRRPESDGHEDPDIARIDDYLLGGAAHDFAVDRDAGKKALVKACRKSRRPRGSAGCSWVRRFATSPAPPESAASSDVGSGTPAMGNVHEVSHGLRLRRLKVGR
jgi:hypothetical protein